MQEKAFLLGLVSKLYIADFGTVHITVALIDYAREGGDGMHSEVKELSRIICNRCEEKEYDKCKGCKIYNLINKIAEQ